MAKFCNRCGKQYEDQYMSCPYCMQQNITYIENQQPRNLGQTASKREFQETSYMQKEQRTAKGNVSGEHSLRKRIFVFWVVSVLLLFGVKYIVHNKGISSKDDLTHVEKEIEKRDDWLSKDTISIEQFKILSEEKVNHDNDLRRARIQIQANGKVLHYDAEYEVFCVKTQSGWLLQDCDVTKQVFTAKKTLTKEQVREDLLDEETVERNDLPVFSKIKCNEINIIGKQMDYLLDQKIDDGEIWEKIPDEEENHIIAECSIVATEISGCVTNTYDVSAFYELDIEQDAWTLFGASQEHVKSNWDLKGTWKCKSIDIFEDYDCEVKIYSMTSDYIEMKYRLKRYDGIETTIEKSKGRESVSYEQSNPYELWIYPKNCRIGILAHSSTDNYPDGALAYNKARLTRNNN